MSAGESDGDFDFVFFASFFLLSSPNHHQRTSNPSLSLTPPPFLMSSLERTPTQSSEQTVIEPLPSQIHPPNIRSRISGIQRYEGFNSEGGGGRDAVSVPLPFSSAWRTKEEKGKSRPTSSVKRIERRADLSFPPHVRPPSLA